MLYDHSPYALDIVEVVTILEQEIPYKRIHASKLDDDNTPSMYDEWMNTAQFILSARQ